MGLYTAPFDTDSKQLTCPIFVNKVKNTISLTC